MNKKTEVEVHIASNVKLTDAEKSNYGIFIKGVATSVMTSFPYTKLKDSFAFKKISSQIEYLFKNEEQIHITRETNGTIVVDIFGNEFPIKGAVSKLDLLNFLNGTDSDLITLDGETLKPAGKIDETKPQE